MPQRESLYHKYPDHRVDIEPSSKRIRIKLGGEVVADSDRTLTVLETNHEPVAYFPRQDVRFDLLEPTSHQTFCPFKGDASYWSIRVGNDVRENAVWSYEDPFPQVERLKDYVAFYPDRVEWERE
jgi:uncharacterized protein (DUF427 family)